MTRIQRKVLLFIQDQQDAGHSVSVDEIVAATGHCRGVVHGAIDLLVDMGHLTRLRWKARSLVVVKRITPIVEAWVWCDTFKELVRDDPRERAA